MRPARDIFSSGMALQWLYVKERERDNNWGLNDCGTARTLIIALIKADKLKEMSLPLLLFSSFCLFLSLSLKGLASLLFQFQVQCQCMFRLRHKLECIPPFMCIVAVSFFLSKLVRQHLRSEGNVLLRHGHIKIKRKEAFTGFIGGL